MTEHRPRSLEVPGVTHKGAPIPMGARVGNMIFSSAISGRDPATGELGTDAASQARFAFQHLKTLLHAGGATLANVGHMRATVSDNTVRDALNVEWIAHFPDPQDRPARHVVVSPLKGATLLQLEVIAVVGEAPR